MGRDIHFYVERYTDDIDYYGPRKESTKRDELINETLDKKEKKWVSADNWSIDDFDGSMYCEHFYKRRNYNLFYFIDENSKKGIPEDIGDGYRSELDHWVSDAHSHGYFLLSDMLDRIDTLIKDNDNDIHKTTSTFINTMNELKEFDNDYTKVRCLFFYDN